VALVLLDWSSMISLSKNIHLDVLKKKTALTNIKISRGSYTDEVFNEIIVN
jgi:hypothetical protein